MPLDNDLAVNFEGKDFASGKKGEEKLRLQKNGKVSLVFDVESVYSLLISHLGN